VSFTSPRRFRKAATYAAGAIAAIALAAPAGAAANTINVTTTADEHANDNGQCALREAIYAANNDAVGPASGCAVGAGNDTIVVPAGTYTLTRAGTGDNINLTGDLDVTEFATIIHTGLDPAVVDANGLDRVFHTSSTGQVRIVGLEITGGQLGQNGGGIFNDGSLALEKVTVFDNQGLFGGGVANAGGTMTVSNSTFFDNTASSSGGGISTGTVGNSTSITSTTIAGNTANLDAGGIQGGVGQTSLRSVLISGNTDTSGGNAPDCAQQAGFFESSGDTLVADPTGCGGLTNGPGDIEGQDPLLGPLAYNGGPTRTLSLLAGSPAINAADECPPDDQRGAPRSACDIGSYERVLLRGILVNLVGTSDADVLRGTNGKDAALGLGSNDRIIGKGGRDVLNGANGKDKLFGGGGKDVLIGGKGVDLLNGGGKRDTCNTGAGKDKAKKCEKVK
jgi:CSLREA domain-containing protein